MPKHIISDFSGGLTIRDKNIKDNQFFIGEGVDIFLDEGYMLPSPTATNVDSSSDVLRGTPMACAVDPVGSDAYIMTTFGDLHQLDVSSVPGAFNDNFDGSNHSYRAIGSFSASNAPAGFADMIIYNISGTRNLFYSYNTTAKGFVGSYPLTGTSFTDAKLDLDTGGKDSPHPLIEWNATLWIGNSQYVSKYVGSTDTLIVQALNLGVGWEITSLFTTNNYIGICAWNKGTASPNLYTESKVFFWDGTSSTFNYSIPINNNKIATSLNNNGQIVLCLKGRNAQHSIGILTENGYEQKLKLLLTVNDSLLGLGGPNINTITIAENKIYFGETGSYPCVFSLGNGYDNNNILAFPFLLSTTSTHIVNLVKQIASNLIYIGWKSGTTYYLYSVNPTNTTKGTATYKAGYKDFGQKIRINYVKFYFKPLVSGDSVTAGLDIDYGTSVTLADSAGNATIAFTTDGAITSKKFKVARDCHAFRPTLSWTAGKTAFSKIIIDYDFILDN
jgi:hypothetical protein